MTLSGEDLDLNRQNERSSSQRIFTSTTSSCSPMPQYLQKILSEKHGRSLAEEAKPGMVGNETKVFESVELSI